MATPRKKQHPLAGTTMSGAEMVIQVIADEGVDTIFGYSGGAILPTYDAIFNWNDNHEKSPINLVVPANEQGAGFMAAGYSRVTSKVGVAVVTSGPGATNCVTPIRDAMADSIPMVLLCGQVPRASVGTDAFQEAPVFNIMSSCAKHVFLIKKEEELEASIRSAFHIARSGRPGPVVIDLPKDVQQWVGTFKGEGMLALRGYQQRLEKIQASRVSKTESTQFYKLLKASKRPLIYAGGGVILSEASAELRKFAKKFKIPVVTTLMGIGAMDTTDDLCLHMLGMHGTAYANYAVDDCDFILAVGGRFDDRVAGVAKEFAKNATIAHIDVDGAEINKVKFAKWTHVGDAKTALKDLLAAGRNITIDTTAWLKHVNKLKKDYAMDYPKGTELIQPQRVLELVNAETKGEAIITTGVGQHQMFAAQFFDFKHPRTWLTSGSMGTMGYGLPAAIGAALGKPGALVIDVDGDGSIRMNLGEMETCTTYGVPVKILLLNNLGDGMVVQWQKLMFGSRFSGTDKALHQKDFVLAAEADGFGYAKCVHEEKDLRKEIRAWLKHKGPAFLEVRTDKDAMVYPMVGPGKTYSEMLTGPSINTRDKSIDEESAKAAKYTMF